MEEMLTPVNDGQVSDGGSQAQIETTPVNAGQSGDESLSNAEAVESVNAESAEVTSGEQAKGDEKKAKPQSREENAAIAKVRKEAEARVRAEYTSKQVARDAEFAAKAAQYGWVDSTGNPIKTEEAYWREFDFHSKLDNLINQGKDPDHAKTLIELERIKGERAAEVKATEDAKRKAAENQEFFDFFKEVNGREFSPDEELPEEVFITAQAKNLPIKYAYAEYRAKAAIEKERNIALGKQTAEVNAINAETSPGSVTGNGQAANSVLTEELISNMSQKEMAARWPDIKKFYKMK